MDGAMKSNALLLAALVLAIVGLFYVNLLIEQGAPGRDTAPILAATTPSVPKQTPKTVLAPELSEEPPSEPNEAQVKTSALVSAATAYDNARGEDKWAILPSLMEAAQARKETLLKLMEQDPAQAAAALLPSGYRERHPEISEYLEEEAELEGRLDVYAFDSLNENTGEIAHLKYEEYLTVGDDTYKLHFAGPQIKELSGSRVRVHGALLEGQLLVNDAEVIYSQPAGHTIKKVAAILYNFYDYQTQPWTTGQIRNYITYDPDATKPFYLESSFSQLVMEGILDPSQGADVFGYWTIPESVTTCGGSYATLVEVALSNGVNLSDYDHIMFIHPSNVQGCAGIASSWVGGRTSWYHNVASAGIFTHELGHNFGNYHAGRYACYTAGGTRVMGMGGDYCERSEYGDPFDIMGGSGYHHQNTYNKRMLNWYVPQNTVTTNESSSGIYALEPIEWAGNGTKALRIFRGNMVIGYDLTPAPYYYYLEYRRPYGYFDNFAPTDPVVNGVTIHLAGTSDSYLLDMVPSTGEFSDAPLPVGGVYSDPVINLTIRVLSATPSGATVNVTQGTVPCVRANPTVDLRVGRWSTGCWGSTAYGEPGETLRYCMRMENHDNYACGPSNFTVIPRIPPGWIQLPPMSFALTTGNYIGLNFNVTSTEDAQGGLYRINETVVNLQNPQFNASDSVYYVVWTAESCLGAAFNISITPTNQSGAPGQPRDYISWVRRYDNNTFCPTVYINVTSIVPPGWSIYPSSHTAALSPNSGGGWGITVTPPQTASPGVYVFYRVGVNTVNTSSISIGNATYNVTGPPCGRANPGVSITPASQQGAPGQGKTYTVSVTNNDQSQCGSSTFNVTPTVPAGWSLTIPEILLAEAPGDPLEEDAIPIRRPLPAPQLPPVQPFTLTLSPGQSGGSQILVTSPTNASLGSYQFTERAINMQAPSYNASAQATYVVALPDFTPPMITISSPQNNSVLQGNNVQISSSATDASGILQMRIWANGQLRATCNNQGTCSTNWNVNQLDPGTYPITVGATDNSPNQNYANATIFVIKQ